MFWVVISAVFAEAVDRRSIGNSNELTYLEKLFPYLPRYTHINPFADIERVIERERDVINRVYSTPFEVKVQEDADFDDSVDWKWH